MTTLDWAQQIRETCQHPIQIYHRKLAEVCDSMSTSPDPVVLSAAIKLRAGKPEEALEILEPTDKTGPGAVISACKAYRYLLSRVWDTALGTAAFVMLNPSTADDVDDDPTIRRCVGFAKGWGYGRLLVVNLYGYRATKPAELKVKGMTDAKRVGPENDRYLATSAREADLVVVAWGAGCRVSGQRDREVLRILKASRPAEGLPVACLGTTSAGFPRHPLYVTADTRLVQYREVP